MSKDIAVINNSRIVVAINVYSDNYEPKANEVLVTNPAYIGGDYVDGYFYPEQPYPSWTRNQGNWVAPVPYPDDGGRYTWDEATTNWLPVSE